MTVTHINPPTLHTNPNFSQATVVDGGRILFVGGQNGTDANGEIHGGPYEQSAQALRNVLAILADQGVDQEAVAKMVVYYTRDAPLMELYRASGDVWGDHPTAITVLQVWALGRPEALIEIEVVASLPPVD